MKRNTKKKHHIRELNFIEPYITGNDIVIGFIMLLGIAIIIFSSMYIMETNKKWIQKDTNVREETIQHLNPNFP